MVAVFAMVSNPALQAGELADYVGFIPAGPAITAEDVTAAQKMWGDTVVAIAKAGDGAPALVEKAALTAFAFDHGPIVNAG